MKNSICYILLFIGCFIASQGVMAQANMQAQQAKLQSNQPMKDKNIILRKMELKRKESRAQYENLQRAESERKRLREPVSQVSPQIQPK